MTRSDEVDLENLDFEIERTIHQRQRELRRTESQESITEMAEPQRTMMDYARPSLGGTEHN